MKTSIKISIGLILSAFLLISATASADNNTSSVDVLNSLNIGEFSHDSNKVTRGCYARAISDILSYHSRPEGSDGVFRDVKKQDKYSGAVYDLFTRGYISGYAGGNFGADDPILYEQAVKIAVSVLGYDTQAKARGGYPLGYMMIAGSIDLLKGVRQQNDGTLLSGDAARLVENTMNSLVLRQTSFGSEAASYETADNVTLLSYYANISKVEDVLYDNGISSLIGNSALPQGKVKIGNLDYKTNGLSAEKLLGYKVCAYVSGDDEADRSLVYIKPAESIKTLQITAKRLDYDNPEFSASNISYYDVYNKPQKAKVLGAADYIYNGKANPDLAADDLKIKQGKLILIDNNSDNVFDVVHVENSEIFSVAYVNQEDKLIYKPDGSPVDLKQASKIEIKKDGKTAELSDIKYLDIVSAKISIDKEVIFLEVSSARINAAVEEKTETSKTVTLNGRRYAFTSDEIFNSVELGSTYEFCLDADSNIACIANSAVTGRAVGVVTDAAMPRGLESRAQVLIFTSEGIYKTYFINPKAKFDGSGKTDQVKYIKDYMKDNLVAYKLNNAGEILEMELPYVSGPSDYQTENSFRQDYWADYSSASGVLYHGGAAKNFNGYFVISDKTKVFLLPDDRDDRNNYSVTDSSYFLHSRRYKVYAYSIGAEDGYSDYVIVKMSSSASTAYNYLNYPAVVSKITNKIDSDGMVTECIEAYNCEGKEVLYSKEGGYFTSLGIKQGDIIRYMTDVSGKVVNAEKIVDGQKQIQLTATDVTDYSASPRMMLYNAYFRYGAIVGCTTESLSGSFAESDIMSTIIKQKFTTNKVYEVDTKNNFEVKASSYNAIKDYKNTGRDYSKLFVHSYSATDKFYVIYN